MWLGESGWWGVVVCVWGGEEADDAGFGVAVGGVEGVECERGCGGEPEEEEEGEW